MDNPINYTALAAECEAKAKAGVGPTPGFWTHVPAVDDVLDDDFGSSMSTLECWTSPVAAVVNEEANAEGHVVYIKSDRVYAIHTTADSDDSPEELERKDAIATTASMLMAEALLRDATKPLHREAYEATKRWMETAAEFSSNADFLRGILTRIGEGFGVAARTSDDGSVQDSVLMLRVPELVDALRAENQRLRTALGKCADAIDIMLYEPDQIHRSAMMATRDLARAALSPEKPNA